MIIKFQPDLQAVETSPEVESKTTSHGYVFSHRGHGWIVVVLWIVYSGGKATFSVTGTNRHGQATTRGGTTHILILADMLHGALNAVSHALLFPEKINED